MPSNDPSTTAPAPVRRRTRTRARMLEAGRRLLAERPVEGWAIDEIVAAAEVGKGSFYNHFTDKAAFAAAVAAEVRQRLEQLISAANQRIDDPAERVARAICVSLNFALTDPIDATLMVNGHAATTRATHALNAGLTKDLEAGKRQGRFAVPELDAAVLFVLGASFITLTRVVSEALDAPAVRKTAAQALSLTLRGLGVTTHESEDLARAAARAVITARRPDGN